MKIEDRSHCIQPNTVGSRQHVRYLMYEKVWDSDRNPCV